MSTSYGSFLKRDIVPSKSSKSSISASPKNVYFLGVARMTKQRKIYLLSYFANNVEVDVNNIKSVISRPNMIMTSGSFYSFALDKCLYHLTLDSTSLIFITICDISYPPKCSQALLDELQNKLTTKARKKAPTSKDGHLDKYCRDDLKKLCSKYSNLLEVDKPTYINRQISAITVEMKESFDSVLDSTIRLDVVQKAADELSINARIFNVNAKELKEKLWWQNFRLYFIGAFIIFLILGISIGIVYYYYTNYLT